MNNAYSNPFYSQFSYSTIRGLQNTPLRSYPTIEIVDAIYRWIQLHNYATSIILKNSATEELVVEYHWPLSLKVSNISITSFYDCIDFSIIDEFIIDLFSNRMSFETFRCAADDLMQLFNILYSGYERCANEENESYIKDSAYDYVRELAIEHMREMKSRISEIIEPLSSRNFQLANLQSRIDELNTFTSNVYYFFRK